MPILLSLNTPGVVTQIGSGGVTTPTLARFDSAYLLLTASQGPTNQAVFCPSLAAFTATYGAATVSRSVKAFFDQNSGYGLWCIRIELGTSRALTVPTVTPGSTYSITIGSYVSSVIAVTGDNQASIIAKLATLINSSLAGEAYIVGTDLYTNQSVTVTAVGVTLAAAVPSTVPRAGDITRALDKAFQAQIPKGIIIAPRLYQDSTTAQALPLYNAIDQWCHKSGAALHIADCSNEVHSSGTDFVGSLNRVRLERSGYGSEIGRSSYFYPWLVDSTDSTVVPASSVALGIYLRKMRYTGFINPGAGQDAQVLGTYSPVYTIDDASQSILNPVGINVIRPLSYQAGFYVWGFRTLASSPDFTYFNHSLILSCLADSLTTAVRGLVFTTGDLKSDVITRAKASITAVLELYRAAGAFYGASPDESYRLICDEGNNPPAAQDLGYTYFDVYVKLTPTREFVVIRLDKVPLSVSFDAFTTANNTPSSTPNATSTPAPTAGGTR